MFAEWPVQWAFLSEVKGQTLSSQSATRPYRDAPGYVGPGLAVLYPEGDAAILEWMTIDGDGFGDLWFESRKEAIEAAQEWGDRLGSWNAVPASEANPRACAVTAARALLGL